MDKSVEFQFLELPMEIESDSRNWEFEIYCGLLGFPFTLGRLLITCEPIP